VALRFVDGADSYATADLTKKWTASTLATVNAGTGRRSTSSLRGSAATSAWSVALTLDAQATWIVGCAVRVSALPAGTRTLLALLDGVTVQLSVQLNADGTLEVLRSGSASVAGGLSVATVPTNTFVYLEFKATIANSIAANTVQVRVDGVQVINVTAGQDCQNSANASANQIRFGPAANAGITVDYDDLYICDGIGSAPQNTFLGDSRIDTLLPTADGTSQQWTPSTPGTHYTLVDDAAPNTTDYVSSATIGQRDTYGMQDLTAQTGTIYGVQLNLAALKSDAGARSIKPLVLSGASEALGSATALSTSQTYTRHVQVTDPATGAAWTESAVNAMQAGAEVA